jgi:uncharacterized protein YbjT (DUF2867 family)
VIVHCASDSRHPETDLAAARNLIDAATRAGGPHLVNISIVGIDRMTYGYYRAKLAVEQLVVESGLPWSNLRATQFHTLIGYGARNLAKLPIVPVPARTSLQPVDVGGLTAPDRADGRKTFEEFLSDRPPSGGSGERP